MKHLAGLLLALALPAAAAGEVHVGLRQTVDFTRPGATAAFAVDVEVADVAAKDGRISVTGRSVGETQVTVVSREGVESWGLVVDPPPLRVLAARDAARLPAWGAFATSYDSETARLSSTLELAERRGERSWALHAANVTRLGADDGSARTSFPSLSFELLSPERRVVLFDEAVRSTPLTLDGTVVRGIHWHEGALAVHAGGTAATLFEDVLLASDREDVVGASYRFAVDERSSLAPSLYAFPTRSTTGGARGAMVSLLYRLGRETDPLRVQLEAGWGGKAGVAADVEWRGAAHRFTLGLRHLPQGIASLGIGKPHGTFVDVAGSGRLARRLSYAASGAWARHELPGLEQRTAYGSAELRAELARGLSATAGVRGDRFAAASGSIRSVTLPLGVAWDGGTFGASALYRWQRNSAASLGGHGGRVGVRARGRALLAGLYLDVQKDVPTVDLVFREEPELARLFAELGAAVHTPEDVSRVLRENPALAQLGYVEGVTVRLDTSRVQAGADLAWLPGGDAAQQVKLHLVLDRVEEVRGLRETRVGTLSYARRLGDAVDATLGVTLWRSDVLGDVRRGAAVLVGARTTFDGPPRLPFSSGGTIGGVVRRDDTGSGSPRGAALAGVEVRLDGRESAVTDAKGRFAFTRVPRGVHRVEAVLPSDAGAYFTTPSAVTVEAGRDVTFGVSTAAAMLLGSVRDDAGSPVAGAAVALSGPAGDSVAVTDAEGRFRLATRGGSAAARLDPAALPAGYETVSGSCAAELVPGAPARCGLLVRAQRSLSGRSAARALVRLVELARETRADDDGRWAMRGLVPGTFTLEASAGGRAVRRTVTVPLGPSAQREVDLAPAEAPAARLVTRVTELGPRVKTP